MLDLSYPNLIKLVSPYKIEGRTESASFLHWFLTNIYRLDKIEADDVVCDGRGDKGIDGIYVNENGDCIDVFQSKIVQNENKTFLFECVHIILGDLIIDLNGEFEDRGGENFDFKQVYKYPKMIKELTNEIIKAYEKVVNRGRVESFSQLWENDSQLRYL